MLSWNINLSQIVPLDDGNTNDILRCILYLKFKFSNKKIPRLFVPHENVISWCRIPKPPRAIHAPNKNNEKWRYQRVVYGFSEAFLKLFY